MGVRLGIDDFGTGYSSLSYLQRLPFDTLKIDRSFVRELNAGKGSIDIVRAILELARSLKLEVVAEGVETEQQLSRLRKLGCTYFQGFLFSKPVDAATAESLYGQTRESGFFPLASEARSSAGLKQPLLLTKS
jgi:EAL domain-containing protein (putative c-di-GMP-specific phosphodiesterase class I)